jgi:hypothetical protein
VCGRVTAAWAKLRVHRAVALGGDAPYVERFLAGAVLPPMPGAFVQEVGSDEFDTKRDQPKAVAAAVAASTCNEILGDAFGFRSTLAAVAAHGEAEAAADLQGPQPPLTLVHMAPSTALFVRLVGRLGSAWDAARGVKDREAGSQWIVPARPLPIDAPVAHTEKQRINNPHVAAVLSSAITCGARQEPMLAALREMGFLDGAGTKHLLAIYMKGGAAMPLLNLIDAGDAGATVGNNNPNQFFLPLMASARVRPFVLLSLLLHPSTSAQAMSNGSMEWGQLSKPSTRALAAAPELLAHVRAHWMAGMTGDHSKTRLVDVARNYVFLHAWARAASLRRLNLFAYQRVLQFWLGA